MNKLNWKDCIDSPGIEAAAHGFSYSVYAHQDNKNGDDYYFADIRWEGLSDKRSLFDLCTEEEAKEMCQSHADAIQKLLN